MRATNGRSALARRRVAALGAAGVATAALVSVPAGAAHAAPNCRPAGFSRTVPVIGYTRPVYYCSNVAPTAVYSAATFGSGQVGTLRTATSWFICKFDGGEDNGSRPHPHRWVYTMADEPSGVWGYVPDKKIISETDSIPNDCFH